MKRISELNIKFDAIYGTSSGALNAAIFSQGDIDLMLHLWTTITNKDVRSISPIKLLTGKGIYDSKPLAKTIAKYVDPTRLKIPTFITVTDTRTSNAVHIRIDNSPACNQALLASASIPVFFPVVAGCYYDGGVTDDYNIGAAAQAGADEIIVCHPSRPSGLKGDTIPKIAAWAYETTLWSNYVHEMENNGLVPIPANQFTSRYNKPIRVRVCIPDVPVDVSTLDFSYKNLDRSQLIQQGYDLAKKYIG